MLGFQASRSPSASVDMRGANSVSETGGGGVEGLLAEPCEDAAPCGAPPAPRESTYAQWRELTAFQQALYLLDETEARWQRLKDIYGDSRNITGGGERGGGAAEEGGAVENQQESLNDTRRRSTPSSDARRPAVEFYSLNWGADIAPAVDAFAEFLGGTAAQYDAFTRQHAPDTVKETFSQSDAEALDLGYRKRLQRETVGTAVPAYVESVRSLALGNFGTSALFGCMN